jgi:CHAD domain-containing protein
LLKAGARRSGAGSKLNRVLADRLSQDSQPLDSGAADTAAATVLCYLRNEADTLRRYDPLVRQDAPDSVHKMRVASRRMRSALQAYRQVLDRDATRPVTDELKWLASELAPARDTEVMAERFTEMVGGLPAELVLGPVSAFLDRTFARQQAEARDRTLAALDSDRYLALHDTIDALLSDPPLTDRAERPAKRELPRNVRRAYRRTRRRMAEVDRQPAGEQRDLALHEARTAAKRLRYATEVAEPAVGKQAKRLRRQLKPIQKLLGDHQDTVVGPSGAARVRGAGAPGGRQRVHLRAAARRRVRPCRPGRGAVARPVEANGSGEEHRLAPGLSAADRRQPAARPRSAHRPTRPRSLA